MNVKLCKTSTTEVTLLMRDELYAGMQIENLLNTSQVYKTYIH